MSSPVYLVTGEDPILRGDLVRVLVAELLGDDNASLALEDFSMPGRRTDSGTDDADDGGTGPAEGRAVVIAALNAATTPPFGTDRRVVVLREAGLLTTADVEAVVRYLTDPLPTTALVLVGGGGKLSLNLSKAIKAAGGETRSATFKTGDALAETAARAGIRLTAAAVKVVSDWLGDDAGRVPGLVELLASAHGAGVRLDVADVEPYLGQAGGVAPYLLTGAIDKGDTGAAIDVLHRLRSGGFHPLQVAVMLHRHYQRLLRLDDPAIRNENDAVAALGGKVKPYPAKLAMSQARVLGSAGIRSAYDALAKADIDLRGGTGASEDAVLEVLVARLAALSKRAARPATSGTPLGPRGAGAGRRR